MKFKKQQLITRNNQLSNQKVSEKKINPAKTLNYFYKPAKPNQDFFLASKHINQTRKYSQFINVFKQSLDCQSKIKVKQSIVDQVFEKKQINQKKLKISKTIRLNTFQDKKSSTYKKQSTSQKFLNAKLMPKMSTYALSTMSSFAKSFIVSKKQNKLSPDKIQKINAHILKINPQELQLSKNNKYIKQKQMCQLSPKKIINFQKFKKQLTQSNLMQKTIHQKIMTEGNNQWQKKYLKKRVSSFSKISTTIKEMSNIFVSKQKQNNSPNTKLFSQLNYGSIGKLTDQKALQNDLIQKNQEYQSLSIAEKRNFSLSHLTAHPYSTSVNFRSATNQKMRKKNLIRNKQKEQNDKQKNNLQRKQLKQQKIIATARSPYLNNSKNLSSQLNISEILNSCCQNESKIKKYKPIKLHTETVYTHFRKNKGKSINTLSEYQGSLLQGRIQNDCSKSIIDEIRKKRASEKLQKQPKRWQQFNFLNFNKIQLYETNLRISSQSWVAIDYLQLKYLRGWKAKHITDYSLIAVRLFIIKSLQKMVDQYKIQLNKIRLRFNYKNIIHQVQMLEYRKNRKSQDQQEGYTLRNLLDTIISVQSLVIGMCRIMGCEDLILTMIYIVGYLRVYFEENKDKGISFLYEEPIFLKDNSHLHCYVSQFISLSNQIAKELNLESIQLIEKHKFQILIKAHALDVSVLFMSCLKFDLFEKICTGKISNHINIKYQVGWSHWQDRVFYFKNQYKVLQSFGFFGFKDQSTVQTTIEKVKKPKQQYLLVYHPVKKTLIIVGGSKINMSTNDLFQIDKWILKTFKRFYKQGKKQKKLCEVLNKSLSKSLIEKQKKQSKNEQSINLLQNDVLAQQKKFRKSHTLRK